MTPLSKRALLRTLAGLAAVSAAGLAQARTPEIAAVDPVGAALIGQAWLAAHPSDAAALRADLFPPVRGEPAPGRLVARVRRDFEQGRVFVHDGWFLSETEARLCALIALA